MSRRRFRRFRRPSLRFRTAHQPWQMWLPSPDEPIVLDTFEEAASLAFAAYDFPVEHELLVVLDERRQVTAILGDPPAEVASMHDIAGIPGLEVPFCQLISIVLHPGIVAGPPSAGEVRLYRLLRQWYVVKGLLLMDVIYTDGDQIRSLAIACDPDPVWFEQFDPDAVPAAPAA